VGGWAVAAGLLPDPDSIWRVSTQQLRVAIDAGRPPVASIGHARWEPFVAEVLLEDGVGSEGIGVTDGVGAGRIHALGGPGGGDPAPRAVLAVAGPHPQIAPLLWRCSALVASGGSPAAHLFEVASSLGVPAVIGVDLRPLYGAPAVVDGGNGIVATLPPAVVIEPDRRIAR
jgi:hypothetical protein